MEKITTDISSFENLRKDGFVYVDKTDLLWRLVSKMDGRQFFISRPRRFGKSLMLSTLRCIFEGKRKLFKGLKIEKLDYDWKTCPVVHLDMTDVSGETPDELKDGLFDMVEGLVKEFGLSDVSRPLTPGGYLNNFFKALAARDGSFVVLVDEYDVPLQGFFGKRAELVRVRKIMHDFYVKLKRNIDEPLFESFAEGA